MYTYRVVKETDKGYWIKSELAPSFIKTKPKWVSKTSRKRYAYPSKVVALESLIARKIRHLRILSAEKNIANQVLCKAREMLNNKEVEIES